MLKIKAFSPTTLTVVLNKELKTVILKAGDYCFSEVSSAQIEQQRKNKVISVKEATQRDLDMMKASTEVKSFEVSNAAYTVSKTKDKVTEVKTKDAEVSEKVSTPQNNQNKTNNKKPQVTEKKESSELENLIDKEGDK